MLSGAMPVTMSLSRITFMGAWPHMEALLAACERTLNLLVLLLEARLALLGHGILISIRGIVARQCVDSGVQRRERRHARNLGLAAVECHKVIHLRSCRL